ncbi:MAG TPA: diaminopimelate decarboxylase [Candidatus Polarisedimenticolaceae bacterium]|nr:diaminopimelate decarboxylase [Candidatus Polarisedimenticolaceae bacterium]
MAELPAPVARHFDHRAGELLVGGVSVGEIARQHGTPLFVYDRGVMDGKLARLRAALPAGFSVYYSIKANPCAAILRGFLAQGCGLEVASSGELVQALAAGCAPGKIVFAGPGKTTAELEHAVERQIGEIHVESLDEIAQLAAIAARRGTRARIGLRINPGEEAQGGAMRMGGKPAPFGIDEEALDPALDAALAAPALEFRGIHLFTGTQILDAAVLVRQYAAGLAIARRATQRAGSALATVDFGGGLGVPYYAGERELDLERLRTELAELFAREARGAEFAGTSFLVEPGRFLVAESGIYLTRVTTVKRSRGKRFVVVDGGMHHHLAASGNLGQVIKRNFPLAVLGRLGAAPSGPADVVGPLCTPLDVLGRDVELPEVVPGDLIGVFQSGAYARAASPLGFLSHPTPPEVLVEGGRATLVRRRGDLAALLADQEVVPS